MTTTRKAPRPTHCSDCGTKLTAHNRVTHSVGFDDVCEACYDYAAYENEHNDDGHDDMGNGSVDDAVRAACPVCRGDKPTKREAKAGHTNTAAKTHTSHVGHDHPATPKARAACRKARDAKA